MIQEKTLEAILPLADILTEKGVRLSAIGSTPLHELTVVSRPAAVDVNGAEYHPDDIVSASMHKDQTGASPHDLTMDEVVAVVAESVQGNLSLSRNTINPIVKRVLENVDGYMANIHQNMLQPMAVVPDIFHGIWNNPILESMVERYENSPAFATSSISGMPELSEEDLTKFAMTGVSRLDSDVKKLIEDNPVGWLNAIYNAAFRKVTVEFDGDNTLPNLEDMLREPNRHRDALVIVHCLAKKFSGEVPEGTQADLEVYRDKLASTVSQSGRAVLRVLEKRDRALRQNELVISYPPLDIETVARYGGEIIVNSEVYKKWLKEGGSPEILFGSFANGSKERGYNTLLENAERFKNSWKRQERVIATQVRFDKFNHILEALHYSVSLEINQADDELLYVENTSEASAAREVFHKRLKDQMKRVIAKDTDNLYCLARKLICRVMFPHTDAETILLSIDSMADANPEIDIREAALLATIEIVSDWVAEMIVCEE